MSALNMQRLPTSTGSYDLWFCETELLEIPALRDVQLCHWLDAEEIRRFQAFGIREHARDFLAGRFLVRRALSQYVTIAPEEWKFTRSETGALIVDPAFASKAGVPKLQFSLSRTRGICMCAVSHAGAIGADVEDERQILDVDRLQRIALSEEEQSQLATAAFEERSRLLLRHWVLKEAYAKAIGIGLGLDVRKVSFKLSEENRSIAATFAEELRERQERWCFECISIRDRYIAAVAFTAK